jgi:predicted DNA binding protein
MPGGIGKVSESMMSACWRQDRSIASVKNTNEIYFHLDGRRVYFDRAERYLYFVDSPLDLVKRTVLAALTGARDPVIIEQLHLDTHKFFNGARRVSLTSEQAHVVLVALRLVGVTATIR